jgi:hypothetical protein
VAKRSLSVRLSNLRLRARFPFHYGRAQAREPNSGLIVIADAFTVAYRVEITSLAARYRLPAIYPFRLFVDVGGLLSYGVDLTDNFRTAATYVVVTGGAIKGVRLITAAVSHALAASRPSSKVFLVDPVEPPITIQDGIVCSRRNRK